MQLVRIRVEENLLTYKRPVGNIPSGRRDFDKANTLPEECERLQARDANLQAKEFART